MTSVALSPKFQIVIPKAIREELKLVAGQRLEMRLDSLGNLILEPELDIRTARGFLPLIPGIDVSDIQNDPEDLDWPVDANQANKVVRNVGKHAVRSKPKKASLA